MYSFGIFSNKLDLKPETLFYYNFFQFWASFFVNYFNKMLPDVLLFRSFRATFCAIASLNLPYDKDLNRTAHNRSAMTLRIKGLFVTLSMMKLIIKWLFVTVNINDTQQNNDLILCWVSCFIFCYAECPYAECPYDECRYAECRGAIKI